jgi:hypothetical protein
LRVLFISMLHIGCHELIQVVGAREGVYHELNQL